MHAVWLLLEESALMFASYFEICPKNEMDERVDGGWREGQIYNKASMLLSVAIEWTLTHGNLCTTEHNIA